METNYQIELANKIRDGRAVGNLYVVTQRPLGRCGILASFETREEAAAYVAKQAATPPWQRDGQPIKWVPRDRPFRVCWVLSTSAPGLHGWVDRTATYPTEAEAVAAASEKVKVAAHVIQVDRAENVDDWCDRGRWVRVGSRKPNQAYKPAAVRS